MTEDFCGTASDGGTGVSSVEVSVRKGSGNYWSGTAFDSATEVWLAASGTTSWTKAFAAAGMTDGSYTIRARATDGTSNIDATPDSVTFSVDQTSPYVVSINRASTNPSGAASVNFTVTFSESVTGVNAADFALVGAGATGATLGTISGSGTTYTVPVNTGTDGTLGLNLTDDNSIADANGNVLVASGGAADGSFTGQTYTIDKTAPTMVSINRSNPAGSTTAGTSVEYLVTFSESVESVVVGDFALTTTGSTTATVSSVTGSGDTRTVTVSSISGSGTVGLDLADSNGTIKDAGGNSVSPSSFSGRVYTIDQTNPSVSSIVRTGGAAQSTNGSSVSYTVSFSEAVTPVVAGDFTLTGAAAAGASIGTPSTSNNINWTVVVTTSSTEGTLRLDISDGDGSIKDTDNHSLTPATFTIGELYTVDKTNAGIRNLQVTPKFSPRRRSAKVSFSVTEAARVRVTIVRKGSGRSVLGVSLNLDAGGAVTIKWDGRNRNRNRNRKFVRRGTYKVVIRAVDRASNVTVNRARTLRVVR